MKDDPEEVIDEGRLVEVEAIALKIKPVLEALEDEGSAEDEDDDSDDEEVDDESDEDDADDEA
jgi:DNA gyrase subunit A